MRPCARHAAGAALACVLALGAPAAAHAGAYDQALHEFQQTGTVNGCNHSDAQLQEAEKELGKSTAQAPAQFATALQAASEQRKSGVCSGESAAAQTQTQAAPAPAPTQTAAPQTTPAPAHPPVAKQDTGGASSGVVLLAIAGAVVVLLLGLWGVARWWAFEPPWLLRWRHATAEAGWRASNAWAEFTDWLRLGR